MAELTVQTTIHEGVPLVALVGELDAYHAPRVMTELESQLGSAPAVVISLKRVTYIDSTGLGILVAVRKQAESVGARLVLVIHPESAVRRTFTITGLLPVFSIFEEDAVALAAAVSKEG